MIGEGDKVLVFQLTDEDEDWLRIMRSQKEKGEIADNEQRQEKQDQD